MEFCDTSSEFLEETIRLIDPFILPTEPQTATTFGDGGNASLEYPPGHFPASSFASFYYPPSCGELLFQPQNFDFGRCQRFTEPGFPAADDFESSLLMGELGVCSPEVPDFNPGRQRGSVARKKGQPSKNLMAERRRRKRLNDRLSLLRSIVPKISKMDRTSILGDTVGYMKELLGRINLLEQENGKQMADNVFKLWKESKANEALVGNSPEFHVERRNRETAIEISCDGMPGMLLTTMSTLEALGLEVEHCVVSCFNDFTMRASCSKTIPADSEDVIKRALVSSAGYGGGSAL